MSALSVPPLPAPPSERARRANAARPGPPAGRRPTCRVLCAAACALHRHLQRRVAHLSLGSQRAILLHARVILVPAAQGGSIPLPIVVCHLKPIARVQTVVWQPRLGVCRNRNISQKPEPRFALVPPRILKGESVQFFCKGPPLDQPVRRLRPALTPLQLDKVESRRRRLEKFSDQRCQCIYGGPGVADLPKRFGTRRRKVRTGAPWRLSKSPKRCQRLDHGGLPPDFQVGTANPPHDQLFQKCNVGDPFQRRGGHEEECL